MSSAKTLYDTAKSGAEQMEHSLLVPVRDIVILPAFGVAEGVLSHTVGFLGSDEARSLVRGGLGIVRRTPIVGESVLAPAIVSGGELVRSAWEICQYPIPSRSVVIRVTDEILTGLKWGLSSTGRELYWYFQFMDATVTRTLSHTQWRVLGYGPYVTLNEEAKGVVLDHLCERYLNCREGGVIGRYELAAHIRAQNECLWEDLRVLLIERSLMCVLGREDGADEWLRGEKSCYREGVKFLGFEDERNVTAMWFYLKNVNGKKPKTNAKWKIIYRPDAERLEKRYCELRWAAPRKAHDVRQFNNFDHKETAEEETHPPTEGHPIIFPSSSVSHDCPYPYHSHSTPTNNTPPNIKSDYPTIAEWYTPCKKSDILIDENRHAVSFSYSKNNNNTETSISMIQRPTLWRFHGPGDTVRRAAWLLDTPSAGLQPFDESQAAVLEDAYLFLQWRVFGDGASSSSSSITSTRKKREDGSAVLLTVQVKAPNGVGKNGGEEVVLVQFRSLSHVTAVTKSLGGALSLWKWRVYRGIRTKDDEDKEEEEASLAVPLSLLPDIAYGKSCKDKDDISHLVLVIHGIGEMLRAIDLFGMELPALGTIVDCCDYLRHNHIVVNDTHDIHSGQRVEYLPVEWHEAFAVHSHRAPQTHHPLSLNGNNITSVRDISLPTIPHLRTFANDSLSDVLYFMTPEHHDVIIDIVTKEMNILLERINYLFDTPFRGSVSIMAHSLGSVIAWDILAHQNCVQYESIPSPETSYFTARSSFANLDSFETPPSAIPSLSMQSQLSSQQYPQLNFPISNAFLLGSPLPLFLLIRQMNPSLDYTLPGCSNLFNIFHPYDPAAYRLEPLLHPSNAKADPMLIPHWKTMGWRMQYKTKFLLKKLCEEAKTRREVLFKGIEHQIRNLGLGLDDDAYGDNHNGDDHDDFIEEEQRPEKVKCGKLNGGRRVDYMLQEKEIENANEYVFALGAHSGYWDEKDLSLFVARELSQCGERYRQQFGEMEEDDDYH